MGCPRPRFERAAQVALGYLTIRTIEDQIRITKDNVASQQRSFEIVDVQFQNGENAQSLGLTGRETFDIVGLDAGAAKTAKVIATGDGRKKTDFTPRVPIDTPKELEYYRHGGILHYVLRILAASKAA